MPPWEAVLGLCAVSDDDEVGSLGNAAARRRSVTSTRCMLNATTLFPNRVAERESRAVLSSAATPGMPSDSPGSSRPSMMRSSTAARMPRTASERILSDLPALRRAATTRMHGSLPRTASMAGVTIFDDSTEGGALPESTPVSGSPCGCTSLCWAQTIAFLTFAFGNISLNEFNQWALSRDAVWGRPFPGFTFPIFYSMWHMSFSALAAYLLTCCGTRPALGLPSFAQLWRYKYGIVPLALCTGLSNWLNNKSFTLISLFLNQTLRAMGPLPTVVFEYVLVGKSYDGPVLACVALISAGSVMACLYHFQESTGLDGNAQWIGASICLVSVVLSALKPVIAMLLMAGSVETPRLDPAVVRARATHARATPTRQGGGADG